MANGYHVWQFRANGMGQVGSMTIRFASVYLGTALFRISNRLPAAGSFTDIKPGMVSACMADGCHCIMTRARV